MPSSSGHAERGGAELAAEAHAAEPTIEEVAADGMEQSRTMGTALSRKQSAGLAANVGAEHRNSSTSGFKRRNFRASLYCWS